VHLLLPSILLTVLIAGIIGGLSEKVGWTRNGIVLSVAICISGALLFYIQWLAIGLGFESAELNAILSSAVTLAIVSLWRRR